MSMFISQSNCCMALNSLIGCNIKYNYIIPKSPCFRY